LKLTHIVKPDNLTITQTIFSVSVQSTSPN